MKKICFCFQMHIPSLLKRYRFFEIGSDHYYYDDFQTAERVERMVQQSYMPLCQTLQEMIQLGKGKVRCALAVTGTTLDLMEQHAPEMIDILKQLAKTGCIEMVSMPYSYSLAAQFSESELAEQLKKHQDKIKDLFGVSSTTLWNTELIYSDELSEVAWKLGYKTIMAEGAKHILSWKSPNYVYQSCVQPKQLVLVRNMSLSDGLSFHFSDPSWGNYPLDAEKFVNELLTLPQEEKIINIWTGAEAFGILQPVQTGILEFLKAIPYYALENGIGFTTPAEATKKTVAADLLSVPYPMSWAGESKDLNLFNGNDLQQEALEKLYAVVERVHLCKDKALKEDWLLLQDANHFHYMSHYEHGQSNYDSAYDAFINYMNILSDFLQRVDEQYPTTIENEELNSLLQTINNQEKVIGELKKEIDKLRKKK